MKFYFKCIIILTLVSCGKSNLDSKSTTSPVVSYTCSSVQACKAKCEEDYKCSTSGPFSVSDMNCFSVRDSCLAKKVNLSNGQIVEAN